MIINFKLNQENVKPFGNYIRGFESDSPESLGEKITTYSSYGFLHNLNRESGYSALVICNKK